MEEDMEDDVRDSLINQTSECCKRLIIPLLCFVSRIFKKSDYFELIEVDAKELFLSLLEKKIDNIKEHYSYFKLVMKGIIIQNIEMINEMRNMFMNSKSDLIRELIATYFIPSNEEKIKNAEISTPVGLVNDMLDKIPSDFWNTPKRVFEPCCGKGNFVLGIVDKFYNGLQKIYPDIEERCNIILNECLYYADISHLNIFITTQLLKCYFENKCDMMLIGDVVYNGYIGNTLELDIQEVYGIDGFDAVIGNPPYQKNFNNKNGRVGGSSLWSEFMNNLINKIFDNGLLLFITPCSWMTGSTNKQSGNILKGIFHKNTVLYLDIENCSKYFKVASTFSYYLIKKSFEDNDFKCITYYKKYTYKSVIKQKLFRQLSVIPKLFTNETINIINKVENRNNNKFNFQRKRDLDSSARKERFTKNGKYNVRHKVFDIRKSNYYQESCMNKHKVVISMPGYIKPLYDYECGCSDATLYNITKNKLESEHLINLLNSNLYKFIINNYRELTGLNNHKNINRLCICTEEDIYQYFQITEKEIELIENTLNIKQKSKANENMSNLNSKTFTQLKKICKERKIKGYSKLKKQELIDKILVSSK